MKSIYAQEPWWLRMMIYLNTGFALGNLFVFTLEREWINLIAGITSVMIVGFILVSAWQNAQLRALIRDLEIARGRLMRARLDAELRVSRKKTW